MGREPQTIPNTTGSRNWGREKKEPLAASEEGSGRKELIITESSPRKRERSPGRVWKSWCFCPEFSVEGSRVHTQAIDGQMFLPCP